MTQTSKPRVRRSNGDYRGILVIGDPHIEGRQPGFRCDDYPRTILGKLAWCLRYAANQRLLPVITGDLFERPRDNPTWIVGELIDLMIGQEVIGIYGNHDCAGTGLDEHDTLSILVKTGCYRLVDEEAPWIGEMNHRTVLIGGTSWRRHVPRHVTLPANRTLLAARPLVIWLTHHDVDLPGYDAGRFAPFEIENVDLVINGHIHRGLPAACHGHTSWLTPGNISRRSRSEAIRDHIPSVLRIDIEPDHWTQQMIRVPHQAAESVFHAVAGPDREDQQLTSRFVDGLRELQLRRTDSGAGLHQFLDRNLDQFPPPVAGEIRELARLVTEQEKIDD